LKASAPNLRVGLDDGHLSGNYDVVVSRKVVNAKQVAIVDLGRTKVLHGTGTNSVFRKVATANNDELRKLRGENIKHFDDFTKIPTAVGFISNSKLEPSDAIVSNTVEFKKPTTSSIKFDHKNFDIISAQGLKMRCLDETANVMPEATLLSLGVVNPYHLEVRHKDYTRHTVISPFDHKPAQTYNLYQGHLKTGQFHRHHLEAALEILNHRYERMRASDCRFLAQNWRGCSSTLASYGMCAWGNTSREVMMSLH
jgi:hypothetical protein